MKVLSLELFQQKIISFVKLLAHRLKIKFTAQILRIFLLLFYVINLLILFVMS